MLKYIIRIWLSPPQNFEGTLRGPTMQNDVLRCKTTSDEKFGKHNKTQKKRYNIKQKSTILYTLENAHNPEVVGSSPASATRNRT